ncbi:hypothetical protein JR316_0013060 [Psilocybe cubensis]|uniref:F-box domain-containing protein n=2 Tax=Psilocybe cubensis TaxID=181762 RepID=A0A8H8CHZ8_PSICU|nr:hypothetical protein JR316_0013060 [Psilocybe cubensis]KAH9474598.1 hypothetical protein JR316_0013060 [Psilocybe cubensis]
MSLKTDFKLLAKGSSNVNLQAQSSDLLSRVPPEITTEIFLNVCDRTIPPTLAKTSPKFDLLRVPLPIVYPLMLGKICKEWRRIAWACPLLWNVIHIPLSLRKYQQQILLLSQWLERSAGCALSIYLEMHDGEGLWCGSDYLRSLFALLVEHSDRWEHIDIFLPKPSKGVLSGACLRVPLLRSACIRALNSVDVPLEFLECSPNLRSLELKRISPKGVDCQNLTRLVASFVSTTDILFTLQAAPNLQYCELSNTYGTPDSALPILQFCLPALKTLKLRDCHSSALWPHFGIAPQLRDLEISEWNDQLDLEAMSSFLSRTQCHLQNLAIATGDSMDQTGLQNLLQALDSLVSLEFHYLFVRDDTHLFRSFLEMFEPDSGHPLIDAQNDDAAAADDQEDKSQKEASIFLPNLRKLGYQLPLNTDEADLQKLIAIITKRWKHGDPTPTRRCTADHSISGGRKRFARLEALRFDPSISTSQILDPLRKEMEGGLKITFDLPFIDSEDEDP